MEQTLTQPAAQQTQPQGQAVSQSVAVEIYDQIYNLRGIDPAYIEQLARVVDAKMRAVRCYESQFITGKTQTFPTALDDIRDRARYWGWAIGTAYAEPFASREDIGLTSLRALLQES